MLQRLFKYNTPLYVYHTKNEDKYVFKKKWSS